MRQFYMQKWLVEVLIRLESRSVFICTRTIDPWDFVAYSGSDKIKFHDPQAFFFFFFFFYTLKMSTSHIKKEFIINLIFYKFYPQQAYKVVFCHKIKMFKQIIIRQLIFVFPCRNT